MAKMLVTIRSARKCCGGCDADYGKSCNAKAKTKLKRSIRRRENSRKDWLKDY